MKVLLIFHFVPVVLGCESDGSLKDSDEVGYIVVAYLRGNVGDAVMGCHEQSLGTLDACADSILEGCGAQLLAEESSEV